MPAIRDAPASESSTSSSSAASSRKGAAAELAALLDRLYAQAADASAQQATGSALGIAA